MHGTNGPIANTLVIDICHLNLFFDDDDDDDDDDSLARLEIQVDGKLAVIICH